LGSHKFVDTDADVKWLHSTQSKIGGFSKLLGDPPDAMHSYMGLAALALHKQDGLQALHADLNIGAESRNWLAQHLNSRSVTGPLS
jgi:geranylgeranyl transferase type-1 subunit beta